VKVAKEHAWQLRHIPARLQQEVIRRVIVEKRAKGIFIKVHKDQDY